MECGVICLFPQQSLFLSKNKKEKEGGGGGGEHHMCRRRMISALGGGPGGSGIASRDQTPATLFRPFGAPLGQTESLVVGIRGPISYIEQGKATITSALKPASMAATMTSKGQAQAQALPSTDTLLVPLHVRYIQALDTVSSRVASSVVESITSDCVLLLSPLCRDSEKR